MSSFNGVLLPATASTTGETFTLNMGPVYRKIGNIFLPLSFYTLTVTSLTLGSATDVRAILKTQVGSGAEISDFSICDISTIDTNKTYGLPFSNAAGGSTAYTDDQCARRPLPYKLQLVGVGADYDAITVRLNAIYMK